MREITIISGKGGTGKTSIVGSFASLADNAILADCDVDAPDLHLLLSPEVKQEEAFVGSDQVRISLAFCNGCGRCVELCRFQALSMKGNTPVITGSCEGCGVCVAMCPRQALSLVPTESGDWFISDTRFGTMVHARLHPGRDNSGKLVSLIRREARRIAEENQNELIICDGSPGIGCPVIASLSGTSLAVIVTEPSLSGLHDMRRVLDLTAHFKIPAAVCVNKFDVDKDLADDIISEARTRGAEALGCVPYDQSIIDAQMEGKSVIEHSTGPAGEAIEQVWTNVAELLANMSEIGVAND